MNNRIANKADGFENMRRLIKDEGEAALKIFVENEVNFNTQLHQQIAALDSQPEPGAGRRLPVLFTRGFVPALAAAVLIAVTAVLWVVLSPGGPGDARNDVKKLEQFFLAVAAAQGETGSDYQITAPAPPAQTETERRRWELEYFLKGAFQQAHSRSYSRDDLKRLFENLLCFGCRPQEPSTLAPIAPGKTDLEERIRNLKKEKVIDHFLDKRKNENQMEV